MVVDSTGSERVSGQRATFGHSTKEQTVSTNRTGKKGKRGGEETQPSTASLLPPKQHPAIPKRIQQSQKQQVLLTCRRCQRIAERRPARKEQKRHSEAQHQLWTLDSILHAQNCKRIQKSQILQVLLTLPKASLHRIHLPSDGSRNVELVELDEEENLEPAFSRLLPAFTLPSWCSIQRTFIQCVTWSGAAHWDLDLAVEAPDLLSQSYPAQGSSKIVMDPLSMTMTEDSRLVPQPKRKAAAGDLPLGTEDGINALQEDMDAMSQRLQRKLEALAEEATAVG
eukprot:s2839_g17.t2